MGEAGTLSRVKHGRGDRETVPWPRESGERECNKSPPPPLPSLSAAIIRGLNFFDRGKRDDL